MEKLNLTKSDADYYKATPKPRTVNLAEKRYISFIGYGGPEALKFNQGIEALYAVAYALKFKFKSQNQDFVVPKTEAFWWLEGERKSFEGVPKADWHWEILIRIPDFIEQLEVDSAIQSVIEKKNIKLASEIYFKIINTHNAVQILHIGSYENEKSTLDTLFSFIEENKLKIVGEHREIYITDPRKTPEARLKTILRYAVA